MRWRRFAVLALVVGASAFIAIGCGDDDGGGDGDDGDGGTSLPTAEWVEPNSDLANTRRVAGPIDSESVDELGVAWTAEIPGAGSFGSHAMTPLVIDGVVYTQDLASNVQALDLESGEQQWIKEYDEPSIGPNGLAVGDGRVYGATPTNAFALDIDSGEELWSVELVRNDGEGIDMAPGYRDGVVYVSTVPGRAADNFYAGNGQGILHALDAETGEQVWEFETVPEDLWSEEHTDINSGGGLWHPPAFDEEGGVYVSVANPAPFPGTEEFPWGSSRPGDNLYTNSLVKLDEETGELEWHNQVLPHDIYDWDLQLPPILTEVDGDEAVLTAGKLGYVYAMDRESGETIWETSVGEHSGNDDDNQLALDEQYDELDAKLPIELLPGFLGGVETQMAVDDDRVYAPIVNLATTIRSQTETELDFTGGTGEMVALDLDTGDEVWKHDFETPAYGAATVVNDLVFTTTLDGTLWALDAESGDVVWQDDLPAGTNSTLSVAGDTLIVAASFPQGEGQEPRLVAYRLGAEGDGSNAAGDGETGDGAESDEAAPPATSGDDEQEGEGDGEGDGGSQVNAMALFSSSCGSCHTFAAAGTTGTIGPNLDETDLDADAIAEQIANGGGGMPAFASQLSDAEIDALAEYIATNADPDAEAPTGAGGPP